MVMPPDGTIYGESEGKREGAGQVSSISYRFNEQQLSPVRHAAGPDGKPLCGAKSIVDNSRWESVPKEATCSICKKRSNRGWR